MATSKGRGSMLRDFSHVGAVQALRRPGAGSVQERFNYDDTPQEISLDVQGRVNKICDKLCQIDLDKSSRELSQFTTEIKLLCESNENLEKCVDAVFAFAQRSKWNSHVSAIFCDNIGDITVDGVKYRTLLLRKLQVLYKDRNKKYLDLEKFVLEVTFLCEIFHHIRIDGACLKVLARPVIDYFGMLVDGGSDKEIEVFVEQFPKCYRNLKENDAAGLDLLCSKIRKQIVCESSTVMVRAMLLEMFELVLTDWLPLSQTAKNLYESLSKPIVKVCD